MKTSSYTIGLDLSDRKVAVCITDHDGSIVSEESLPNTRETYLRLGKQYPRSTAVLETGSHSPWVSRCLKEAGLKTIVANARKLRAIYTSDHKSDLQDARMLAKLGRIDPQLLGPIKHRSESAQRDLVRMKVRTALVKSRVNQMNSVRFLLKSLGVKVPSQVKASYFAYKTREQVEPEYIKLVEPLLDSIDSLSAQIKEVETELKELAHTKYPVTEQLEQIPGVGPMTSLAFVLTIEDPKRFKRARDVGAYLGLTPRIDQSGDTNKQLRITKAGNTELRCLLVNCSHYILGRFGPDSDLREAGLRICARGGSISKKKAAIATARKLAVTMMAIWQSGCSYQPLRTAA